MGDGKRTERTERTAVYRFVLKHLITHSKNSAEFGNAVTVVICSEVTLVDPAFLQRIFRAGIIFCFPDTRLVEGMAGGFFLRPEIISRADVVGVYLVPHLPEFGNGLFDAVADKPCVLYAFGVFRD